MSPGSLMPPYPWLITDPLDNSTLARKISVLRSLGVPYPEGFEDQALADLEAQAGETAARLQESRVEVPADREIIALIAYLQRMGTDIRVEATR